MGEGGCFPAAAFTKFEDADAWVAKHRLTGMLSVMPLNQGLFDWAVENDVLNLKPEKLEIKSKDPSFIVNCATASLDHYHYKKGIKE